MPDLKLVALDHEDLAVVSAHTQDAVLKLGDMRWSPAEKRFVLAMNRFVHDAPAGRSRPHERRRAVLHFDRVEKAAVAGLRQDVKDAVLVLLAIRFEAGEEPTGRILLEFAGGGTVRLDVECIEAQLCDLGAAWATVNKPQHDLNDA